MGEAWRAVPGYEALYEVSNQGRVRRVRGSVLTPKKHNRGYYHVILAKDGRNKSFLVHRLVAKAFIPTNDEHLTVNHIDEDKLNNRVENLEWCSMGSNIRKYQENHPNKVGRPENLTPVHQFDLKGNLVKVWVSVADAHRTLNFSTWSISQCCIGKRKTAHGYKWRYVT